MKKYILSILTIFSISISFGQEIKTNFKSEKSKRDSLIQILIQKKALIQLRITSILLLK